MDGGLQRMVDQDRNHLPPGAEIERPDDVPGVHGPLALAIEPDGVIAEVEDRFFRRGLDDEALNQEALHVLWTSAESSLATVAWPIVLLAASLFALTAVVFH
jgi:hypothetical protein